MYSYLRYLLFLISFINVHTISYCQALQPTFYMNQVGFYPNGPKTIITNTMSADSFHIRLKGTSKVIYSGVLSDPKVNQYSSDTFRAAVFDQLTSPGVYELIVSNQVSTPFEIKPAINQALVIASLKSFYYQRASTALSRRYAGKWHRLSGHPDTSVIVHPSASSFARPTNSTFASPGGWYDAGDFNKYVVNSGIATGTLLSLIEDFPFYTRRINVSIPESSNSLPDILDETLWNVRWMLTMQDPGDGGVYHKLTNPRFDGIVMPADAKEPRYAVQKSVTAALNFAAVMAKTARVLEPYKKAVPGLADSCLLAAEKAWKWSLANPDVYYDQEMMNLIFDPDVVTGAYQDNDSSDEKLWAATELFITTRDKDYLSFVQLAHDKILPIPNWQNVGAMAYYSLARSERRLGKAYKNEIEKAKQAILISADSMIAQMKIKSAFQTVMGTQLSDFVWGSNAVAANQGMLLIKAFLISRETDYLNAAYSNLDYLLGRNRTGYCFVTGFGKQQVMHPHHRVSEADKVTEPIPGLLAGGPNPGQQDKCEGYLGTAPDISYVDAYCSYASNETAINWNAPLVYLIWGIDALSFKK